MGKEVKKLSLIGEIEKIKKRMAAGFPSCISVSDSDGNKVIPAGEYPYPFLPDNVFAVHSCMFYEMFTLDINKDGVFTTDFIKVYGEGFKDGLKFLEREKIDINQLDDENKKANLIKRLKRILYERKDKSGRTILNFGFSAQAIWTDKSIFQAGKHNGMITAIDQFAERGGLDEKDLNNEPQRETNKKKENLYPEIFKKNGFDVFEKMHADYKDKDNSIANYSFLFYAMKKDELIHCGGMDFIKFLASDYDVHIDKIDSRQSGQNKRTGFYNVIKAQ